MNKIAFPEQAATYAAEAAQSLPEDRAKPPDYYTDEACYKVLTGSGIHTPEGVRVLLRPKHLNDVEELWPLITSLSAEWLAVAACRLKEDNLIELFRLLTLDERWHVPDVFAPSVDDPSLAPQSPYCMERKALLRAILGQMLKRTKYVDIPAFFRSLSFSQSFVAAVQSCAGDVDNGPLFVFWLEVSGMFASRARNGRLKRSLHPVIYADKTLALEAAAVGNLAVLKTLDADGYDVNRKVGGGCCGGGKLPVNVALQNGHEECVAFIDDLKNSPPVLRYDPLVDQYQSE